MTHKFFFTFILALSLFLNSCGSNSYSDNNSDNNSNNDQTQSFTLEEKKFLHELFLTEYLWYDQVASNVDYTQFTTPQKMIDELSFNPPDLWSFTMSEEEYENFSNQKTTGFGFAYTSDFFIYFVRINAPSYEKLRRGDQILEINSEVVTATLLKQARQYLNTPTTFTVLREGAQVDVTVTPSEYSFNVSLAKIITQGTQKIGYLRYDSFTESSVAEFEKIFDSFKFENIGELVIDLRYNAGGSIATTSALIDNISNTHPEQRQIFLDWNANFQSENSSYHFESTDLQDGNELDMQRIFFLVTKNSASASEAIINALKPYLGAQNVVTVGSATHGKPVGMSGRIYKNNFYFLINFFIKNDVNDSTDFDGIPASCAAQDDITHVMGDEDETMLATALYYIQNNACP